jgi:gliding motility-associated-like protein
MSCRNIFLFFLILSSCKTFAQTCIANIVQQDTTVCPGSLLHLNITLSTNNNNCNIYSLNAGLQNGLIGWYPFCGNTNDQSPQQNNGFPSGPLTYGPDRYNNLNTAIRFTGNGESVRTTKIERNTTNSFSYVTWVNTSNIVSLPIETINPNSGFGIDLSTSCVIHATHGYNWNLNAQHTGAGLYISKNGVFVLEHTNSVVATPLVWTGTLSGWHSVAIVYQNHLPTLYIDGKFAKTGLITPYTVHPSFGCDSFFVSPNYPYISCGFGKGFNPSIVGVPVVNFKGSIDDIKIYNRALTAAEINELYSKDMYNILWSTGETTTDINVQPTQPSKYWVKVSDGVTSCTDTITVSTKPILTNDTTICAGSTLQLKAANALSYQWSPATGLNNTTIQNPVVTAGTANTAVNYSLTFSNYTDNLVTNGDFELGNTGFYTNYTYCNTGNCLFPLADNGYSIGTNANFFHAYFSGTDHTSSKGNFMIVNGANPNLVVWRQTIPVTPNTNYAFGTWISTLIAQNTASIRFSINGQQLGNIFAAPPSPNQWVRYFTQWNSGVSTSAVIEVVDVYSQASGNDFGLDDIFFGKIVSCTDNIKISAAGSLSVSISTASVISCPGIPVKFKASVTFQTNTTTYQWKVNGINAGSNSPDFSSNSLSNGDIVTCTAADNTNCASALPAVSNAITMNITGPAPASLKISASAVSVCAGTPVTFTAVPVNEGAAPVYQWKLNGSNTGSNSTTFTSASIQNGDQVSCVLISNNTCSVSSGVASDTIIVSVKSKPISVINAAICAGGNYFGHMFSGIFTDTFPSVNGCDSIRTVTLTVKEKAASFIEASICEGDVFYGHTTSGNYTDVFTASNGCDSTRTLSLKVIPIIRTTITASICEGATFQGYSTSGNYENIFKASNGCDSIRTLHLVVIKKPVPYLGKDTSVCNGSILNLHPGEFNSYLWQDGSTQPSLAVYQSGTYTVTVQNSCGMASAQIKVAENVCANLFPNAFSPNDDRTNDIFRITNGFNLEAYHLVIYNRWGQKVYETSNSSKGWDGKVQGKPSEAGAYVWYCSFKKGGMVSNMKGIVMLIK